LFDFLKRQRLEQLIVVHLATPEVGVDEHELPRKWSDLERLLGNPSECRLTASTLYAIAALDAGFPFINFTMGVGAKPAAVIQLARERATCHMGNGIKSVTDFFRASLIPAIVHRNLHVTSSIRHQVEQSLSDTAASAGELESIDVSKYDGMLQRLLGYQPSIVGSHARLTAATEVGSAWEHLRLRGFLGSPLTIQMNWQSVSTAWSAATVLDVARFAYCGQRLGLQGPLDFLAGFFTEPLSVKTRDHALQTQMLMDWARTVSAAKAS
jgi:myo-inositol-1-phosphate synthase